MTTRLYLSPHFDDAILSCGATIAAQVQRGERVVVATLCAAAPTGLALSPFAEFQHQRWLKRHPDTDLHMLRRAEDEAACAALGAEPLYLSDLDCIYRQHEGGWLYASEEALFGPLHPDDDSTGLHAELEIALEVYRPDAIYAPLAAGNHVDHQRARAIALSWAQERRPVWFYEDLPYAERVQALWRALNLPAPGLWQRQPQPVDATQAAAKVAAIACYGSQLDVLFDGDMPGRVHAYMARVGNPRLAEVFWRLHPSELPSAQPSQLDIRAKAR